MSYLDAAGTAARGIVDNVNAVNNINQVANGINQAGILFYYSRQFRISHK